MPNVVGELLVPFTAPVLFGSLGPIGQFQLSFVPAMTIPQELGQPLFMQAGVFDGTRMLASYRDAHIYSL